MAFTFPGLHRPSVIRRNSSRSAGSSEQVAARLLPRANDRDGRLFPNAFSFLETELSQHRKMLLHTAHVLEQIVIDKITRWLKHLMNRSIRPFNQDGVAQVMNCDR